MAIRKKTFNYFEALTDLSLKARQSSIKLMEIFKDCTNIKEKADSIHDIEHEADDALHTIMGELNRSFITPIDREDIIAVSNQLDDIIDKIEDVSNLFDMYGIADIRPESLKMAEYAEQACDAVYLLVKEFSRFKESRQWDDLIINVNRIEAEGDFVYRNAVKSLFANEKDPISLMKWRDIYDTLEDILDYCEDLAVLLNGLAIKNS